MPAQRRGYIVRITALALAGAVNLLFLSLWLLSRARIAPEAAVTAMIWINAPLQIRPSPKSTPGQKARTRSARMPMTKPIPLVPPPPATAPSTAITVDWYSEGLRAAGNAFKDEVLEKPAASLDSKPKALALPGRSNMPHKAGDTEHFEGGEVITWINERCYYRNRAPPGSFGAMPQKICKVRSMAERRSEAMAAELEKAVKPDYLDRPLPPVTDTGQVRE